MRSAINVLIGVIIILFILLVFLIIIRKKQNKISTSIKYEKNYSKVPKQKNKNIKSVKDNDSLDKYDFLSREDGKLDNEEETVDIYENKIDSVKEKKTYDDESTKVIKAKDIEVEIKKDYKEKKTKKPKHAGKHFQ